MNTKQFAKIMVLGIGAMLILNAATSGSSSMMMAEQYGGKISLSNYLYGMSIPFALCLLLTVLLFSYVNRLTFDESVPTSLTLLDGGLMLLGAYLVVMAIPHVITNATMIGLSFMADRPATGRADFTIQFVVALINIVFGYLLTRRTDLVKKALDVA